MYVLFLVLFTVARRFFWSLYWRVLRLFALSSGNWAVINRNASELSTFPFPFPVALYHLNSSIQFLLIYPSKS